MRLENVRFQVGPLLKTGFRVVLAKPVIPCLFESVTECEGVMKFTGGSNGLLKIGILRGGAGMVFEPQHPYDQRPLHRAVLRGTCDVCGNDATMLRDMVDEIMWRAKKHKWRRKKIPDTSQTKMDL